MEITTIDRYVLMGAPPPICNVGYRMSWASKRQTTREEDQAYCLMGLFNVNMPLLYGEGRRAFQRLQEEIMKITEDYTLFTWRDLRLYSTFDRAGRGILSQSPMDFQNPVAHVTLRTSIKYADLEPSFSKASTSYLSSMVSALSAGRPGNPPSLTSRGVSLTIPLRQVFDSFYQACLTCTKGSKPISVCIFLERLPLSPLIKELPIAKNIAQTYRVVKDSEIDAITAIERGGTSFKYTTIYIKAASLSELNPSKRSLASDITLQADEYFKIREVYSLLSVTKRSSYVFRLQGGWGCIVAVVQLSKTDTGAAVLFSIKDGSTPLCEVVILDDINRKSVSEGLMWCFNRLEHRATFTDRVACELSDGYISVAARRAPIDPEISWSRQYVLSIQWSTTIPPHLSLPQTNSVIDDSAVEIEF